jgi:hypothetical protein
LRHKKNICLLNLFLFLGSFILFSANSLTAKTDNTPADLFHHQFVSHQVQVIDGSLQQLLEENETENDFELLAFILPFYFSYYQVRISHLPGILKSPFTETLSGPIYLAIHNFRI